MLYLAPLVRPWISWLVPIAASSKVVPRTPLVSTLYPVIGNPPLSSGACQRTSSFSSPGSTPTDLGTDGTLLGTPGRFGPRSEAEAFESGGDPRRASDSVGQTDDLVTEPGSDVPSLGVAVALAGTLPLHPIAKDLYPVHVGRLQFTSSVWSPGSTLTHGGAPSSNCEIGSEGRQALPVVASELSVNVGG